RKRRPLVMKNPAIQSLSDHDLVQTTKQLVKKETELTRSVIEHLMEIDERQLYLEKSCSSLFSFCVEELGYCGSSAQARVQAVRLLRELPEPEQVKVHERVLAGSLSLSHLSKLETYLRGE